MGTLSDLDKEELFAEFAIRYSEMDKEDKRISSALNRSAMNGLTEYWEKMTRRMKPSPEQNEATKWLYREYDGLEYFAADGLYNAYLAIRKVIPYVVGAKRSLEGNPIAGSHPGYKRTYVLDPEKDKEEAYEIGKRLIDTMLDYLKEATEQPGYSNIDEEEGNK